MGWLARVGVLPCGPQMLDPADLPGRADSRAPRAHRGGLLARGTAELRTSFAPRGVRRLARLAPARIAGRGPSPTRRGLPGDEAVAGSFGGRVRASRRRRSARRARSPRTRSTAARAADRHGGAARQRQRPAARRGRPPRRHRPRRAAPSSRARPGCSSSRAIGAPAPARTVTFASVSGGTGGQAGMTDLLRHLTRPVDAVIDLGDLGGPPSTRRCWWAGPRAPARRRCASSARSRSHCARRRGSTRAARAARSTLPRLMLPVHRERARAAPTPPACPRHGCPRAASWPPSADVAGRATRLDGFGRAALRSLSALDHDPRVGTRRRGTWSSATRCSRLGRAAPRRGPAARPRCSSASTASRESAAAASRSRPGCVWVLVLGAPVALTRAVPARARRDGRGGLVVAPGRSGRRPGLGGSWAASGVVAVVLGALRLAAAAPRS